MQGYPASKTLAEKAAWKYAEENKIDLVTVIPSLMAGPPLTSDIPSSIHLAMSLITGDINIPIMAIVHLYTIFWISLINFLFLEICRE